jgi:hypothetical protein
MVGLRSWPQATRAAKSESHLKLHPPAGTGGSNDTEEATATNIATAKPPAVQHRPREHVSSEKCISASTASHTPDAERRLQSHRAAPARRWAVPGHHVLEMLRTLRRRPHQQPLLYCSAAARNTGASDRSTPPSRAGKRRTSPPSPFPIGCDLLSMPMPTSLLSASPATVDSSVSPATS